jgi:hypothetical protein
VITARSKHQEMRKPILVAIALLICGAAPAHACDARWLSAKDLATLAPDYAHVFAGTVTRSESARVQFDVGEVFKGSPSSRTWYRAKFPLGDCSWRLVEGETSIFFLGESGADLWVTRFHGVTRDTVVEVLGVPPKR